MKIIEGTYQDIADELARRRAARGQKEASAEADTPPFEQSEDSATAADPQLDQ